jgi:flagellar hook-associated protein 3 FlgL
MLTSISGAEMRYLADLNRTQSSINQTTAQVTSGKRVTQASDDPADLAEILQLDANIAQNSQVQTNLSSATSELQTADTTLQSVVSILEQAGTLASEGSNSTETADERTALVSQVSAMQQELVSLSRTQVNGRYIFSGDQDTQPAYQLDAAGINGVDQLLDCTNTRTITDASGTTISIALTAQQIFDPQNADGTSATGNTFAAINDLLTALQNNDEAGIVTANTELQNAGTYVNQQLTFYGAAEERVSDATTLAQKFQTQMKTDLSTAQDTDIPAAAEALSQEQVQMQAATSAEANILQMKTIFDYIG